MQTNAKSNAGTSVRLPRRIDALWTATAKKMGLNRTATLVTAIRLLAKSEGVSEPDVDDEEEGE
jgi:hypothetical protein